MKTTYGIIKSFRPCPDNWKLLLKNTNPDRDMNKEVDLMDILKLNEIEDLFIKHFGGTYAEH